MQSFIQNLAKFAPGGAFANLLSTLSPLIYVVGCLIIASYLWASSKGKIRLTDAETQTDITMGLVVGAILGALTGLLWWSWNPIKVVPPYIHLRVFSFFVPLVGILFGRGTGFICGWVATMVWAPLSGAFSPLHTIIFDGIFVGLTGWIPAVMIKGNLSNAELLNKIQNNTTRWYFKIAAGTAFSGLFMSFFVAASLELLTSITFWTGFWAIGIISDTPPMILFTAPAIHTLLISTKKAWSWMPRF